MEIKTLSSALVLSLLMAGTTVMAMGEDQEGGSKAPAIRPAETAAIPEETQAQPPAAISTQVVDEVTTTPKVDASPKSWSILPWNWFGESSTTTTPAVVAEQEKKDESAPVTIQEPAPQDEPTPAQKDATTDGPTPTTDTKDDDSGMMNLIPAGPSSQTATTVSVKEKDILTWWEWAFGKKNNSPVVEATAIENAQVETSGTDSPQGVVETDSSSVAAVNQMPQDLSQSILELPEDLKRVWADPKIREMAQDLKNAVKDAKAKNSGVQK